MSWSRIVLALACGAMVLSGVLSAVHRQRRGEPAGDRRADLPASRFAPRQRPVPEVNPARDFSDAVADAVEKVMPSVVVIRTERIEVRRQELTDMFGINHYIGSVPVELQGEGSGVIISESGHILTSWHVIDGARGGWVVLDDGTKLGAELVGHDKSTDLAVLKIKNSANIGYPAVEFGDSDEVRVGQVAIAIGSPFSLQSSVTVGHVSQKGRQAGVLDYEDFIQTDAAINEGNSGGALIDVDGRLIGITAAIKTDGQKGATGIAFAVPSNLAMVVAKSIIEKGWHEWPWVGMSFQTLEKSYRDQVYGGAGVVVSQVWNNTPAARAGLQRGSVVVAVDDQPVATEQDIARAIYSKSVGDPIRFTFEEKDHGQRDVELFLENYPGTI